jgi:hypothetical protein
MASRLDRLRCLVESDLQTLPEQSVSPVNDQETEGGIALNSTFETAVHTQTNEVEPSSQNLEDNHKAEENLERRFVWITGAASSYNLGDAPQLPASATKLPPPRLQKGQVAQTTQSFTPISALAKFPYKFCNKSNLQDIASAFFDGGKFWAREWDL